MDADASHLQRFTDVPYVIEAPASKAPLASAAASAFGGARVRIDERGGLAPERYRAILESVRAQINADLGAIPGWRIELLDRTAPDMGKEGARIERTLGGMMRQLGGRRDPGAFAQPFPVNTKEATGCVVVNFPPRTSARDVMSEPVRGAPVPMQGITDETFQRAATWHEVGHCLLGASEVRADTFSALMAIRHGIYGADALATLAASREASEWLSPIPDDDHFIAASLWQVVARADALAADPKFMSMGIAEIAGLAKDMADRFGLGPEGVQDAMALRRAMFAAATRPVHFVRGADGRQRRATVQEWGAAHALDLPEITRMDAVVENLVRGARPMASFRIDLKGFEARVSALAEGGDPTARAMLDSLRKSAQARRKPDQDFATVIPRKFAGGEYAQRVIAMTATARLAPARPPAFAATPAGTTGPAMAPQAPAAIPAAIPASVEVEEPSVPGMR